MEENVSKKWDETDFGTVKFNSCNFEKAKFVHGNFHGVAKDAPQFSEEMNGLRIRGG